MSLLLTISSTDDTALQKQIFQQLCSLIRNGTLKPGDILPATRTLSQQLGVSRNTITLAYAKLADEGYIEMRESVGTFVAADFPEPIFATNDVVANPAPDVRSLLQDAPIPVLTPPRAQTLVNPHRRHLTADFWVGRPDPRAFPAKSWAKLIQGRLLSSSSSLTEYRDPAGCLELREAIALHLRRTRGITTAADNIIIVGGCQDGLNLVCRMMLRSGGAAIVENPCYQGAAFLFENFGATLHPARVDGDGLVVSELPEQRNALAYITPSHQYPLGVTLSLERRHALLAWAARTSSHIVEDDYDSDFRFNGGLTTALKGLDTSDRVLYLGTFSKCMGPGLRLGYLVVPSRLADTARAVKTLMSNGQPWLEQAALADFMSTGLYDSHLRQIRRLYLSRRNALRSSLTRHFGKPEILGGEAGMHLVWKMPDSLPTAQETEAAALRAGVGVYTVGSGGAVNMGGTGDFQRHLVLGYSSLTENQIEAGIEKLAQVLAN